jgi:hypothetical protein
MMIDELLIGERVTGVSQDWLLLYELSLCYSHGCFLPLSTGVPCQHGMARSQVADGKDDWK